MPRPISFVSDPRLTKEGPNMHSVFDTKCQQGQITSIWIEKNKKQTNRKTKQKQTNKRKKKKRRKTSFVSLTGGRNEWLAWNQIPTARPHSFGFKNTGIQYYQSAPDNTEIYSMNVSVVNYTVCKNTYFLEIVFETSAIWNQCFNGHKRWRHEWQW